MVVCWGPVKIGSGKPELIQARPMHNQKIGGKSEDKSAVDKAKFRGSALNAKSKACTLRARCL